MSQYRRCLQIMIIWCILTLTFGCVAAQWRTGGYVHIYTNVDGERWCLAAGRRCYALCVDDGVCLGIRSDHSLSWYDEENLFWLKVTSSGVGTLSENYCREFMWRYEGDYDPAPSEGMLCYAGISWCMQWDGNMDAGHEIGSGERNAKIDDEKKGGGDIFTLSNNRLCATAGGDECCLEWDGDRYTDWYASSDDCYQTGREAKFDCGGGADYIYTEEADAPVLPPDPEPTPYWPSLLFAAATLLIINVVCCVYMAKRRCCDSNKKHLYGKVAMHTDADTDTDQD